MTTRAGAAEAFSGWTEGVGSAAVALASGDAEGAAAHARAASLAITQGEAGARARLLAGLALTDAGRPAEAAAGIASALPSLPVTLAAPARARLGDALSAAGRPAGAAAAYEEALRQADPADRPRLATAAARAWLAAGQPAAAAGAAAPAAAAGDPAARVALARAWLELGDPRAAPALRDLAVERAGDPEGEEAAAALRSATPPLPLSLPERLSRARRLLAAARALEALEELDLVDREVGATPHSTVLRAMAMLRLGRPADAERLAAGVASLPGVGDPAAARYVLARATARQGRLDEAIGWYRRVAAERPAVPGLSAAQQADLPDDAAYLVAWLPYDAGRFAESIAPLRRFARTHPAARRAPDARWFSAWARLRAGDEAGARSAFRELSTQESGPLRAAALYWQGRLQPTPEEAAPWYRGAVAETPDGWYGLLAAGRLEQAGEVPPAPPPLPPSPLPEPPRDPRVAGPLAQVVELAGAGLRSESAALLQRLSRAPDARSRASLLGEVGAFTGDPEVPYRMARDHLPPGVRARRWAFPDAHESVLAPAARALGVDPALALAVMRRESAFVAAARSGAAAEGVLQLRPETARRMLALLGIPGEPDLSDPPGNLRLGIAYLALLSDRFGNPAAVLAAYNAGPVAAAGWTQASPGGVPLDAWAEDVPYRETRLYVRSVLADWAVYRRLRGEPPLSPLRLERVPPAGPGVAF